MTHNAEQKPRETFIRVDRMPSYMETRCQGCARMKTGNLVIRGVSNWKFYVCDLCIGELHRILNDNRPENAEGAEVAVWP